MKLGKLLKTLFACFKRKVKEEGASEVPPADIPEPLILCGHDTYPLSVAREKFNLPKNVEFEYVGWDFEEDAPVLRPRKD